MTDLAHIRNFSIVAHIDHGKSTLADRLIQMTGGLERPRDEGTGARFHGYRARARHHHQGADRAPRVYKAQDGETYTLNLIDTPGHVDFAYEVNRSLAACEGSLLVVDASQGVEAQTLANVYQAIDNDHEIVPVLNKIDLPAAEPERIKEQIEDVIGLDASDAVEISAKTGLPASTTCWKPSSNGCPRRKGETRRAAQGDAGRQLVRRLSRRHRAGPHHRRHLKKGDEDPHDGTGATYDIDRVGVFTPKLVRCGRSSAPARSASSPPRSRRSRTPASATRSPMTENPRRGRCPASSPAQPVVFCGLFPVDAADFEDLRAAMGKLRLNDASFSFEMETSAALGFGFRCGFLGPAASGDHPGAAGARIRSRPDRHRALGRLPRSTLTDGSEIELHNPVDMPDPVVQDQARSGSPGSKATILTPDEHLGAHPQALPGPARHPADAHLCRQARHADLRPAAQRGGVRFLRPAEIHLARAMPPSTIRLTGYRAGDLVKMQILVNAEPVDALSTLVHRAAVGTCAAAPCAKSSRT